VETLLLRQHWQPERSEAFGSWATINPTNCNAVLWNGNYKKSIVNMAKSDVKLFFLVVPAL
jgi:hypothetical protein